MDIKRHIGFSPWVFIALLNFAVFILSNAIVPPASAQPVPSTEKSWSDGTVEGADFQQKPPEQRIPPESRPKFNGKELKAEITTILGVEFPATDSTAVADPTTKKIVVTTKSEAPKASAIMDKSKSWIDPASKNDKKLLDHEQGHMDGTEKHARLLQAKFNKMKADGELTVTTELPKGTSIEDIKKEIKRQEQEIDKRITEKHQGQQAQSVKEDEKYDDDTKHGEDPIAQKKAREAQRKTLQDPNTKKDKKKGPIGDSRSNQSILFDSTSGLLTIDQDFIVGINPNDSGFIANASDPFLGSEVILPTFALVGEQDDGTFFFSGVSTTPRLEISDGANVLFATGLDYLIYDPDFNLFFGLGRDFDAFGDSDFIDRLVDELTGEVPALFGIEFLPDANFYALTAEFTTSGTSAVTNGLGARAIETPEPGTATLFAAGLLMVIWLRRRRYYRID